MLEDPSGMGICALLARNTYKRHLLNLSQATLCQQTVLAGRAKPTDGLQMAVQIGADPRASVSGRVYLIDRWVLRCCQTFWQRTVQPSRKALLKRFAITRGLHQTLDSCQGLCLDYACDQSYS